MAQFLAWYTDTGSNGIYGYQAIEAEDATEAAEVFCGKHAQNWMNSSFGGQKSSAVRTVFVVPVDSVREFEFKGFRGVVAPVDPVRDAAQAESRKKRGP